MFNFIEFIPIILAIIAAISCSYRFKHCRRSSDKISMFFATLAALLLIIAQTSWWVSYIIEGDLLGTKFANNIWTIFDSLIMICLIVYSQPWRTK